MEPAEVEKLANEMREAGASSMTHVSLIISVLAVLVALVTVMGHRAHTATVMLQARSVDQWNEYQARKIRAEQVTVAGDLLALQPSSNDAGVQAKLQEYKNDLAKWGPETNADADEARHFESRVTVAEERGSLWDLSEALLEIAVLLASITLLTRQHRYAFGGVVLGLAGVLLALSTLLVR